MIQRVPDRLTDRALGQHLILLVHQPGVDLLQDRPRSLLTQRLTGRVIQLLGVFLHVVEPLDQCQRHVRSQRVAALGLVELPPRVCPVTHLDDRPRGIQRIVARIGIRLEITPISLELPLRAFAGAVGRVVVHRVGVITISQIDPKPALPGLPQVPVQHRHHRVVGLDHLRFQDFAIHGLDDRLQQLAAGGHPVAGGLSRQLHPIAAENPFLAIQGQMIGVLADDDLGQQPRPGEPLLDRLGKSLGDDHVGLARRARILCRARHNMPNVQPVLMLRIARFPFVPWGETRNPCT